MDLAKIRKRLEPLHSEYQHALRLVASEKANLKAASESLDTAEQAQSVVQQVAQAVQQQAHERISSVVSRCLEAVFDQPYRFHIRFEQKRGKTEANLLFLRDDGEVDPIDAAGGGVIDVAAFALRLACLMLAKPTSRRLLVLDEPMKMLSRNYIGRMRDLLLSLSAEMGVQILLVTHNQELACGKIIEIGQ